MLSVLQGHGGHSVQRVGQRVRFAADVEALWYLRQDVMMALSRHRRRNRSPAAR